VGAVGASWSSPATSTRPGAVRLGDRGGSDLAVPARLGASCSMLAGDVAQAHRQQLAEGGGNLYQSSPALARPWSARAPCWRSWRSTAGDPAQRRPRRPRPGRRGKAARWSWWRQRGSWTAEAVAATSARRAPARRPA
jgi:hypothetical protein